MMSTSNESSTMEDSTILHEISDFDIKAPISVTISFDDDPDDIPIKKEIVTDEYQEEGTQETVISAFFPVSQAQQHNPSLPTEEQKNAFVVQNNYQDAPASKPDNLKHKLLINNTSRKRKTENLEMCQQKQFKTVNDTSNDHCDKENSTITFTSDYNRNNVQSNPNDRTNVGEVEKNSSIATTLVEPGLSSRESTVNQSVPSPSLHGVESEKDKMNSCVNYLASLSEIMRRVMQAFGAHRQQHISLDEFQKIKEKYFNLSHKTLVTMMLPEEKNKSYLNAFINETLRRARKKCGPYYTHTHQDYANLLHEMLMWAKKTQEPIPLAQKSQPPIIQNSALVGSDINKSSVQEKLQFVDPNNKTAVDNICIFSSGPPERALSINVDPNLKRYFQNTFQNSIKPTDRLNKTNENVPLNPENNNTTTQLNTAVECLTSFVSNSISSSTVHHRPPVIQPTASLISNSAPTQIQQHPALPSTTQRCTTSNISNNMILSHQRTPAPMLQSQLRKPPLSSGYLQQQLKPQPAPPSYEHSLQFQAQPKQQQATLPYDQSRRLQAQSLQQRQIPSQYNQAQLLQTQLNATQLQYLQQAQPSSQYGQSWQLQGQLGQSSISMPQYNQPKQSPMGSQQGQCHQQLVQNPTESWPTVEELLSLPLESTPHLPYQSNNEPRTSSGQWQPRQLQQANPQLPQTYGTEWHQGQVYQGQVPTQTQKGSPRSASTDSGFISPLNFNVPADQTRSEQTMPTTPQEPEASMPMIVHVTSLSDKAAFVEIDKCVVCMKNTRQVCMGCRKIYYCSYQCQTLHWATHAPYCSQENTTCGS